MEQQRGVPVSGEEVARRLGISRAAVWKAVEALRRQGAKIEAVPGSGYRLAPKSDFLTPQAVLAHLPQAYPVRVLEETASTNLVAKQWALEGTPHGSMVLANRQTGGKGRLGRSFQSPAGGLYLSIVLRPQMHAADAVQVTAAAAVAVLRAVQSLCGLGLGIKWVNDLFYKGKKCCGILTEAGTGFEAASIEYIVVGIGLNFTTDPQDFLPELREITASLFPQGGAPCTRGQLAAAIHTGLLALFAALPQKTYLEDYRQHSLVLGRQVTVLANSPYEATATGITDDGQLVVQTAGGGRQVLSSGEISVKIAAAAGEEQVK